MQVTERALTQRVDRALAKQGRKLVAKRGTGGWAVIDLQRNTLEREVSELESEARRLGVLKPYEELVGR